LSRAGVLVVGRTRIVATEGAGIASALITLSPIARATERDDAGESGATADVAAIGLPQTQGRGPPPSVERKKSGVCFRLKIRLLVLKRKERQRPGLARQRAAVPFGH
jgi:hypothetical protein